MSKSDTLFELVKSLDSNEKRYFTVFASQYGDGEKNNALRLFSAMRRQDSYNEKPLIKLVVGNTNDVKKYSNTKHYLYKLILKSMQVYRSETTIDMQLKSMLSNIDFLFDKGLYKQCKKMIAKAVPLADKFEHYPYLIELERYKLDLMRINYYSGVSIHDLEQDYNKIFHWLRQYKINNEYRLLADKMFLQLKQKGLPRGNTEIKSYQKVMSNPLLTKGKKHLSYDASYSYHAINIVYHSIMNDFEKEYKYIQKSIESMEAHPHQIASNPMPYLSTLYNLIFCKFQLNKYSEIPAVIKQIRELDVKPQRIRQLIFYSANSLELKLFYRTGQFQRGIQLIKTIEDKLTLSDVAYIERQLELTYYVAYIYFGAEKYNLANSWVNKILNATGINIRSDLLCFAQILQLIIHYENDNRDLLEYRTKSVNRFLTKKEQMYPLESIVLGFFTKVLPKTFTRKEKTDAFKILKTQIEKVLQEPFGRKVLDYFDFISWIDSKIKNILFAEVVRGKADVI